MKPDRLSAIIKGALAALGAMALYAISLGCFIALMLLVISMEEGGESLPSSALPLTEAVILLSQGTGFTAGTTVVAIMPLLLTLLLVALVAQCASRAGVTPLSWGSGAIVWIGLNLMGSGGTTVALHDTPFAIAGKTACVWTIGCLIAAMPAAKPLARLRGWSRERVPEAVRGTALLTAVLAGALAAALFIAGFVACVIWIVRGWHGMTTLFAYDGMENGSRVLTTIASCAWLPNLVAWAVSWLAGAGFHIGDLGSFTMWAGQSSSLPPLPVFGLLPEGVADDRIRVALQCVIPVIAGVLALLAMLLPGPMKIRPVKPGDDDAAKRLIVMMLRHLICLCMAAVLTVAVWCLCFLLADGSLGVHRLAHVGVDIMPSARSLARFLAFGLAAAWLAVAVAVAAIYGIHWIVGHRAAVTHDGALPPERGHRTGKSRDDADAAHRGPKGRRSAGSASVGTKTDTERDAGDGDTAASTSTSGVRKARSIRSERSVRSEADARDDHERGDRRAARTIRSARGAASGRTDAGNDKLDQPTKEETDDNNESSD
ncbi:cell division protein PerM [Bifidobacterium platyrrhinorum]|uniref:Lipoprotein n=1 Tax=Bifidobacterium platyrrhinorum TaxID=2661628 RepID=A0A6L9SSJ6_9BIFI|nr:DUF6350 family protein [Bifidobacterium platyrrhinorum]NEG54783.1 hypothetical protein [Bifidobacterium platyrrhinorum]